MPANSHSLQLDGSGSFTIPHQTYINFGSGSYTISFWFKAVANPGTTESLWGKSSGSNWAIAGRVNASDGTLNFQQWNGTTNPSWGTTTDVCDNTWHYITVVLNDAGTNRAIVDGTQEGTDTHLAVTTSTNLTIGTGPEGIEGSFAMDELVIYNSALSAATAYARRYYNPVTQGYSSVQGYYTMNNTANDSSSNANNATATGTSYSTTVPFSTYAPFSSFLFNMF